MKMPGVKRIGLVLSAVVILWSGSGVAYGAAATQEDKERSLYVNGKIAEKVMAAEWTVIPKEAYVGDVVLLRSGKPGEVKWQGKTYPLQAFGAGYYAYLPVPRSVKPGTYKAGGAKLTVKAKKFKTQYLKVTKKMEAMKRNTKRIEEDQKKVDKARSTSQPEFLFTAPFLQPVKGRISTEYGETRYVNGKFDKAHNAIDYAAKTGTPVKAANDGIVVLAESLYLSGNSIYIDHGMHLFSQYIHLSKIKVKPGQKVKRGDVIGEVGSTGFSTGPHLHFGVWVRNEQVNPNLFYDTTPFRWLKA